MRNPLRQLRGRGTRGSPVSLGDRRARPSVGWVVTYGGQSGGNWVRRQVTDRLSDAYSFETVLLEPTLSPRQFCRSAWQLATHDDPSVDLWVESVASLVLRAPGRRRPNVLLLHHLRDPTGSGAVRTVLHALKNRAVRRRMRAADRVVVVSDFWASYLAERGISDNVTTVYNGLPVSRFDLDPERVEACRAGLCGDSGGPLVHVGPCAPGKGGHEVCEALSGTDATLVTTGRKTIDAPVRHLNPPYDEYLEVLAACDVLVAMSEVREGWGLQVQEAMLCGTPVVGSGRGGMGALLEGGDQEVCRDFEELPSAVEAAIADARSIGADGREFASQFTLERMLDGYRDVFEAVRSG